MTPGILVLALSVVALCPLLSGAVHDSAGSGRNAQIQYGTEQRSGTSFNSLGRVRESRSSDIECNVCKIIVTLLHGFLAGDRGDTAIETLAFGICVFLKIEDNAVCKQIVKEFETEVMYVINNLSREPQEICGLLFGDICSDFHDPFGDWNVTLPNTPKPPVVRSNPPKPDAPKLRILHVTDIHLDLDYREGLNTDCGEPICCRLGNGPPKQGSAGAGKWGDYRGCDLPLPTLVNFFQHLNETQDQFDVVYWTGDLPAHNIWSQSRADQLGHLELFTKLYNQYLPNKPLFPSVGNHESAPVNSFPAPFITGNNSMQWLYEEFLSAWSLPAETNDTILKGGYYTVSPYPGFRVVSLNDNYCNNLNFWLLMNMTDPANELSWLIEVLTEAEKNDEKVHILGHIPTGSGSCFKGWSWNYYDIINRFENTVTAQFFGHTHNDEYVVFYDNVNFTRPVSIGYIAGSLTPKDDMNPGYRIYTADGNYTDSSWQILDHTNYILNLTEANNGGPITWAEEYSAKEAYGMDSVYPADWDDLIGRMAANQTVFDLFYKYYKKSHVSPGECSESCKQKLLCSLQSARSHDKDHLCRNRA